MTSPAKSAVIRTFIVDDHEIVRRGLQSVLELTTDIAVVGNAAGGRDMLDEFAAATAPPADVVLLDLVMPGLDGISTARELRSQYPDVKVLVLTSFGDVRHVRAALETGVAGYLLKDAEAEVVVDAVRRVFSGQLFLDQTVSATLARSFTQVDAELQVTPRERDVLQLVAHGHSSREIATKLFLSERTARTHISHLLMKFGMQSRVQLALWATANGFGTPDPPAATSAK